MDDMARKRMQEEAEKMHRWALIGVKVCAVLAFVVILTHLVCSSGNMKPWLLRAPLLGLRNLFILMLGDTLTALQAWYSDFFFAPLLVFLLSALPFTGLLLSAILWLATGDAMREKLDDLPYAVPGFRHKEAPTHRDQPQPDTAEAPASPAEPVSRIRATEWARAMERLNTLNALCAEEDPFTGDRGVRVQVLSRKPEDQKDYILEWYENGSAVVPISQRHEILLNLNENAVPCIVGLCSHALGNHAVYDERQLELEPEIPKILMRQDEGREPVNRYAITWLGG